MKKIPWDKACFAGSLIFLLSIAGLFWSGLYSTSRDDSTFFIYLCATGFFISLIAGIISKLLALKGVPVNSRLISISSRIVIYSALLYFLFIFYVIFRYGTGWVG